MQSINEKYTILQLAWIWLILIFFSCIFFVPYQNVLSTQLVLKIFIIYLNSKKNQQMTKLHFVFTFPCNFQKWPNCPATNKKLLKPYHFNLKNNFLVFLHLSHFWDLHHLFLPFAKIAKYFIILKKNIVSFSNPFVYCSFFKLF